MKRNDLTDAVPKKTCTKCGIEKEVGEFNKFKEGKFGVHAMCRCCAKKYNAKWYEKNKQEIRAKAKARFDATPPENRGKSAKRWYELNKELCFAKAKARHKRFKNCAWSNKQKVLEIYLYARFLTKSTGIQHEVDHIVPLTNDFVCGLHNEFNLRVVTMHENRSKHNKFEVA